MQQNQQKVSFLKQVFPFEKRNKIWLVQLIKSYLICIFFCFILSLLFLLTNDQKWKDKEAAKGESSFDESLWFIFCTFHSLSFGDLTPITLGDRIICCLVSFMGYYFIIFMMSLVVLSQLTGEQKPTLKSTPLRIARVAFPSFAFIFILFFVFAVFVALFEREEKEEQQEEEEQDNLGQYHIAIYYVWCIFHKMPYGEFLPKTDGGKVVTSVIAIMGILYQPFIIALVAIRRPSAEQHQNLIQKLRVEPLDANLLGYGYVPPSSEVSSNNNEYDEKKQINFELNDKQA